MENAIEDGYRLVTVDDVNKHNGVLRGKVIKGIIHQNFWTTLKLDGGEITSTNLCMDEACEAKEMRFAVNKMSRYITTAISPDNKIITNMGK